MRGKINNERKVYYQQQGWWGDRTLLDCWNEAVTAFGDREYVVDNRGNRYTYRELDHSAQKLASWLVQSGIRPMDVISFQIPVWSEFVVTTIACLKIGAVIAPVGLSIECSELIPILNMVKARAYLAPSYFRGLDRCAWEKTLRESVPSLQIFLFLENEGRTALGTTYQDVMGSTPSSFALPQMDPNSVTLILHTSGTTAGPKAVMLTHNNIIYSEDQFNKAVGITKDDIMFMPAPLSHATGFHHGIISPMLVGGKLVLQQRFIRSESVEIMNREKCTYSMGATPFIFDLLKELEESERQIDSLKFYLCGGAPVPGHLIKRAWDLHRILVCEVYDSTESVPHVLVRPENALENDGANAGTAIPGTEIRIVDEHRNPLPPGVIGEEASRGPAVFVGYLNNQAVTEQALDNDGWFYSGDLAVMDELGQLKITDRKKDLIIRGGENLNINDIANALAGCPGMDDCAIVGMPDDRLGERICAYLEPSVPGTVITKEAVIAFLASKQVSKRFWPERIEMADHIPRTESGKVARYLLVADIKKKLAVESV